LQTYLILDKSPEAGLNRATMDLLFGNFYTFYLFYACWAAKLDDFIIFRFYYIKLRMQAYNAYLKCIKLVDGTQ
jgi:hypothetical protein